MTPLATPSLGSHEVSVIRQRMAPGHANPPHTQTHDEVMVLLSGCLTVVAGEQPTELQAGDALTIPAQTTHSLENRGTDDAEWLIISAAGMQFHGPDGAPMTPDWAR